MKRLVLAALACAVLVGSVGIAGASGPRSTPTKKINKNASIVIDAGNNAALQLDPHKEANSAESPYGFMLYDRLFYLNKDIELEPMIATKWAFSPDGLTFTVTVRSDAVFHDGSAVTADAVKQSIDRALTLTGSTAKTSLGAVTAVDVVGTDQVKFTLNRPAAELPYALARAPGTVINPKAIAVSTDLSKGDANMAGSGPYVATEWTPAVKGVFTRASTPYWDKKAGRIKNVTVLLTADPTAAVNGVKSGQAEASLVHSSLVDTAKVIPGHKLYTYVTPGSYNLMFKDTRPGPVSNIKFRQALAMAIDRQTISKQLLNGTCLPAYQPFPEGTPGSTPNYKDPFPYNLTKAKQAVVDSGVGSDPQFSLLLGAGLEPQTSIGTALQAAFKDIGVTMNVTTESSTVITQDFSQGRFDAYIQVNAGQGYPTLWMTRYILQDGTLYKLASGQVGADFGTLVKQANDPTLKGAAYQQLWDKINLQFAQNAWSIPVCYDTRFWVYPKDVKNVKNMSYVWAVAWDPRYLARTKKG